ncbi:hypothetical protein CVM39_02790 [Pseudooceanicola antarcticus]|uniref:Secreted protein n=1 Tax=Pseudooceanicola antarcticus TaxID=1247613 RepID=A0ABX4MU66_9RHOB|nr:hypothetical protein CVM39_02790 [Pseudooceanicola antarcticus]
MGAEFSVLMLSCISLNLTKMTLKYLWMLLVLANHPMQRCSRSMLKPTKASSGHRCLIPRFNGVIQTRQLDFVFLDYAGNTDIRTQRRIEQFGLEAVVR